MPLNVDYCAFEDCGRCSNDLTHDRAKTILVCNNHLELTTGFRVIRRTAKTYDGNIRELVMVVAVDRNAEIPVAIQKNERQKFIDNNQLTQLINSRTPDRLNCMSSADAEDIKRTFYNLLLGTGSTMKMLTSYISATEKSTTSMRIYAIKNRSWGVIPVSYFPFFYKSFLMLLDFTNLVLTGPNPQILAFTPTLVCDLNLGGFCIINERLIAFYDHSPNSTYTPMVLIGLNEVSYSPKDTLYPGRGYIGMQQDLDTRTMASSLPIRH